MPLISVIVPVYNAGGLLSRAVQSALDQTLEDFELILIDDGSTDGSGAVCDGYAQRDDRVRALHQKNSGVSVARNRGIAESRGQYIAFLDADDWLEPDYLAAMHALLAETGAKTAACGNWLSQPDGSRLEEAPPLPGGYYEAEEARAGIVLPLLADRVREGLLNGYIWRYLFDAELIRRHKLRYSGAYLEDELFLIEYFSLGASLAVVNRPLYHYYQNLGSVTRRYLPGYLDTFFSSLAIKEAYVRKYAIGVPEHWRDNTCWAGLLIAVANEFAPGNDASFGKKLRNLRKICKIDRFRHAIEHYVPENLNRNKAVVVSLIRRRMYLLLAALYTIKNRNRG